MKSWFARVGVFIVWCGFVAGCDSGGKVTTDNVAGAPTEPSSDCQDGPASVRASCTCDDGRTGTTVCTDADEQVCQCTGDPFTPDAEATFKACGGEPFGTWRATKVVLGARQSFEVTTEDGSTKAVSCAIETTAAPDMPDFRLDVEDGGNAEESRGVYAVGFDVLDSCLDGATAYGPLPGNLKCVADEAGISHCITTTSAFDVVETWARSGTVLTIGGSALDYCVDGDTLTLHDASGGETVTMSKVQAGGAPLACSLRTADNCTMGMGCHGLCAGGDECTSAGDELSCTNRAGCSWDPTHCSGTPFGPCELKDFDIVPGCWFYSAATKCGGSTGSCATKMQSDCVATPGCTWGSGCVGGSLSCSDAFAGCTYCEAGPGCTCNTDGSCLGSTAFSCPDMKTVDACESWGPSSTRCSWQFKTCNGTATPCGETAVRNCLLTPGCEIDTM